MDILQAQIIVLQLSFSILVVIGDDDNSDKHYENQAKIQEGTHIASTMMYNLIDMWQTCYLTTMPGKSFLLDNIQSYVMYPARTTVGYAPKFTSNRKFLGNLVASTPFKKMIERDENELRLSLIEKMKFCDTSIMDQDILKDFYDREVDQSKQRRK